MALTIGSVSHNSMITRANATSPKSMVVWIGSAVSAVQIAHRGPPVPRGRWGQGDRLVRKAFLESEVRSDRKALKESRVLLGHRVLLVKPDLLAPRALPVLPGQLGLRVLQAKRVPLGHKALLVKPGLLVLRGLPVVF